MIKNIFKGIIAYSGTFKLITSLKLWSFFVIPIIISIVVASIIFGISYGLSDEVGRFIANIWVWEWGKETFATISTFIGGLLIIVVGLIVFKHIVLGLSAPFMGPVSERIEKHMLGENHHFNIRHRNSTFVAQLWRGLRINLRNLMMELLLSVPILLLGLIPVLNIFTTVILFLIQAYYAGFGNMDYTLERHFSYSESLKFVRKNRGIAIGNGLVFIFFLFIPVIGILLVLPLSVTAATVRTVEALKEQES